MPSEVKRMRNSDMLRFLWTDGQKWGLPRRMAPACRFMEEMLPPCSLPEQRLTGQGEVRYAGEKKDRRAQEYGTGKRRGAGGLPAAELAGGGDFTSGDGCVCRSVRICP